MKDDQLQIFCAALQGVIASAEANAGPGPLVQKALLITKEAIGAIQQAKFEGSTR